MKLKTLGKSTSNVEVTNTSPYGIWLYVKGQEFFLPYQDYPWFKSARVSEVYHVTLSHGHHICWPDLDIDLELESLRRPEKYPLLYRT